MDNERKLETKVILIIFIVGTMLAGVSLILKNTKFGSSVLSPKADSFNIFSYFTKKEKPKYTIYGYLPYWTLDKIEYFQLDKLTDIAYFGLQINADGTFKEKGADGNILPGYNNWKNNEKLNTLIQNAKKEDVRVALTIISHEDAISDEFLNCRRCWDTLLINTKKELDSKEIVDINLNFEYVEYTEDHKAEKFAELTRFLNEELDKIYGESYVVVTTFADSLVKPRISSRIDLLSRYADGIFIMAYDFHRPSSDHAGPVAPIGGAGSGYEYDILTMLNDYIANAPPNKLIMGVPYYGYNWLVTENREYAQRKQGSEYTGYSMSQAYSGIMNNLIELGNIRINWDERAKTPYFSYTSPETGELRQVYFDNVESLEYKYKLIKEKDLAGVGIWALGYDGGYVELWKLLEREFIK